MAGSHMGKKVYTPRTVMEVIDDDIAVRSEEKAISSFGSCSTHLTQRHITQTTSMIKPPSLAIIVRSGQTTKSLKIIAAIDTAVQDDVDIISLSLRFVQDPPFHNDPLAIAAFGAERKGIFIVLGVGAGNDGPDTSTVRNVAQWMITVGASTIDRMFPARLKLDGGEGQSLYIFIYCGSYGLHMREGNWREPLSRCPIYLQF
ncbi:hypothetical protein EJB05_53317, partial [Eragrostis curvula]